MADAIELYVFLARKAILQLFVPCGYVKRPHQMIPKRKNVAEILVIMLRIKAVMDLMLRWAYEDPAYESWI